MNVGLITYDFNHLKTEYVVKKLSEDKRVSSIQILAMPFKEEAKQEKLYLIIDLIKVLDVIPPN